MMDIKQQANIKRRVKKIEQDIKARMDSGVDSNEIELSRNSLYEALDTNDVLYNIILDCRIYNFNKIVSNLGKALIGIGHTRDASRTVNAWLLSLYVRLLNEYDWHQIAVRSFESPDKEFSMTDTGQDYISDAWGLCGLYCFDIPKKYYPFEPILGMVTAHERGETNYFPKLQGGEVFSMLLPLIKLLYGDKAEQEANIQALSKYSQLSFLEKAWHDDALFEQGLEELCLFHLSEYSDAMRYGSFYPTEHYGLFPTWIFALDKCREKTLGKRMIPDNALTRYGKRILSMEVDESQIENDEVFMRVKNFYQANFSSKKVDFYAFWRSFNS